MSPAHVCGGGKQPPQTEAVLFYTIDADQGHPGAQYNLAVCYHYGHGVAADMQEALKYYRLAAEGGDTAAIFNLAVCCTDGIGMAKDTAEGIRLYTIAAKQGYVKAQVNLASCYERGIGVPIDIVKAKFWYRQAADQGDTFALQALSQLALDTQVMPARLVLPQAQVSAGEGVFIFCTETMAESYSFLSSFLYFTHFSKNKLDKNC